VYLFANSLPKASSDPYSLLKNWGKKMAKEILLTERSIQTYSNFGIEPRCRRCGRVFSPGDTIIKTKVHAYKMDNPFFCIEHFYTETTIKTNYTPIGDDLAE